MAWLWIVVISCAEVNMRIALLGATGFVGSAILNEALVRAHTVTAVVPNGSQRAADLRSPRS